MKPVKSRGIKLHTLVVLQAVFAALALVFLFASGWSTHATGAPLSAAPVVLSIVMFLVYSGCLLLPRFGKVGWYRVAMAIVSTALQVGVGLGTAVALEPGAQATLIQHVSLFDGKTRSLAVQWLPGISIH